MIEYHLRELVSSSFVNDEEDIMVSFCHLKLLRLLLTNEDYRNPHYFEMFNVFVRKFLNDDFDDQWNDTGENSSFESYMCDFLRHEDEDAYGGNGSYNSYLLSHNYIRDMMKKFRSEVTSA